MQIILNGEVKTIPQNSTAQQLVESMGLAERRLAMEVNQEIVPRSTFDSFVFSEGDKVEIVHAIGGG